MTYVAMQLGLCRCPLKHNFGQTKIVLLGVDKNCTLITTTIHYRHKKVVPSVIHIGQLQVVTQHNTKYSISKYVDKY